MQLTMHIYEEQPGDDRSLRRACVDAEQQYLHQAGGAAVKLTHTKLGWHFAGQKSKGQTNEERSLLNPAETEHVLSFLVEMAD